MVDILLTRADRTLSPEKSSVWPRTGPSTPVWIFEGKNIFLRVHPQTRDEGVLSQEIGQFARQTLPEAYLQETPLKKKIRVFMAVAASVLAHTWPYNWSAEG